MIDFEDKKEVAFRDRYKVGGKIQIKDFQQLDAIDQNNVTRGNPGKHHYLGKILTIVEVCYEKDGRSYCVVREDNEAFCWFESLIRQKSLLPSRKKQVLPII